MTGRAVTLVMLAVALTASGCASSTRGTAAGGDPSGPVVTPPPAEHPYDGPLYVTDAPTHPGAGAAGQIVQCETWGSGGFNDAVPYAAGATGDSPERALANGISEWIFNGVQDGLQLAKTEQDRVLYDVEVDGVIKQAVIVHDGPATEGAGGPGWYVESWAVCDASELPRAYTDSIGLQIWTAAAGHPVATTKIAAWRGPEHCDWQSMTFLELGKVSYVRDPKPEVADYFAEPYQAHAKLPGDAVDTGYRRDGARLWLSPDGQRAYVGTPDDVEVWPREQKPLGCA